MLPLAEASPTGGQPTNTLTTAAVTTLVLLYINVNGLVSACKLEEL